LAAEDMPKGPKGQKHPADVIGNAVPVDQPETLPTDIRVRAGRDR
jgi:hypothetical protein